MTVLLDTHALIFLFGHQVKRFGKRGRSLLETADLAYSPASRLELAYLREKGVVAMAEDEVLGRLTADFGLTEAQDRFADVTRIAAGLSWTRDVFDRLIVAHALLLGARLITQDGQIKTHYPAAVW